MRGRSVTAAHVDADGEDAGFTGTWWWLWKGGATAATCIATCCAAAASVGAPAMCLEGTGFTLNCCLWGSWAALRRTDARADAGR